MTRQAGDSGRPFAACLVKHCWTNHLSSREASRLEQLSGAFRRSTRPGASSVSEHLPRESTSRSPIVEDSRRPRVPWWHDWLVITPSTGTDRAIACTAGSGKHFLELHHDRYYRPRRSRRETRTRTRHPTGHSSDPAYPIYVWLLHRQVAVQRSGRSIRRGRRRMVPRRHLQG